MVKILRKEISQSCQKDTIATAEIVQLFFNCQGYSCDDTLIRACTLVIVGLMSTAVLSTFINPVRAG